jgi:hypothetical protein
MPLTAAGREHRAKSGAHRKKNALVMGLTLAAGGSTIDRTVQLMGIAASHARCMEVFSMWYPGVLQVQHLAADQLRRIFGRQLSTGLRAWVLNSIEGLECFL